MMKAKTFLVVGGFALCLLSGCTHYESEPTFGKVPDIVCRYDNKAHALQLRINRSSGDERRKYTKEQEDLLHKELPQTLRDEKVDEIVGREIPVDCRTDYFSIDKFVITEVDKDGSILLNGKILFNVNFEREYDLGYVGLTTDLCDMAGTAYNSIIVSAITIRLLSLPVRRPCVIRRNILRKAKLLIFILAFPIISLRGITSVARTCR